MESLKQSILLVIVFILLASDRETEVSANSFPLPNIIDSPHIKNQSLVYCGDEFDPTVQVLLVPRKYECSKRGTVIIRSTPKVDVFSLICYSKFYVNNELLLKKIDPDMCSRREDIKCPLPKGVTQTFQGGLRLPCIVSKAHYRVEAYCTNENNVMTSCFKFSFTVV